MKVELQNLLFVLKYRAEDENEKNTNEILNFSLLTRQVLIKQRNQFTLKLHKKVLAVWGVWD